ncbi:hypothetical protein LCGC14_1637090 [marine sediment metagenome]|uniref:Uncharacterized protein n=1 Tax=marine sediment metagenome TaxID=412755 RepID=A0A0F9L0D0_9ZZZZ
MSYALEMFENEKIVHLATEHTYYCNPACGTSVKVRRIDVSDLV